MLAGAMMLDFLGEAAAAELVDRAVRSVLADQRELTPDLGGKGTTESVTAAIQDRVASAR